jgi:hypothetical protein
MHKIMSLSFVLVFEFSVDVAKFGSALANTSTFNGGGSKFLLVYLRSSLVIRHEHDHRVSPGKREHPNGKEAFRPKPLE